VNSFKIKLYSFLASIIFIPIAMLGQFFGRFIGMFLAWFNSLFTFFSMPIIFSTITVGFVSGAFGGWIAAKAVMRMNRIFDFKWAIILPSITLVLALIGTLNGYFNKNDNFYLFAEHFISNLSLIILYVVTLKDEANFKLNK
jgi:hypothetical protein